MADRDESHEHNSHGHGGQNSRGKWVLIGFLAIAGFFLFAEHKAHVLGILPFLLLLACPLMHFFMHGGHEGHGSDGRDREKPHEHGDSTGGEKK